MAPFREAFLGKRFVCCALTIVYSIYNTVGQPIASIYDLGGIFISAPRASVNMSPRVVYIGYGPPYRTIYITYTQVYYPIPSRAATFLVHARVRHSQRLSATLLRPWVAVKKIESVLCAHCNCMTGLGDACSHVAAVLFALECDCIIIVIYNV